MHSCSHQCTASALICTCLHPSISLFIPLLLPSCSPLQLYGAATMNNTLALGVFAALVYFRDLDWQFSAGELVLVSFSYHIHFFFPYRGDCDSSSRICSWYCCHYIWLWLQAYLLRKYFSLINLQKEGGL